MSFRYFEAASHAAVYNRFRPSPPPMLMKKIIAYITEKIPQPLEEAIDVGCGGGQSTNILAPYFKKVQGFDPSEKAILEANRRNTLSNVIYRVGSAEEIDCPDTSVQLVTAGQACHWFDLPKFYAEAGRVLVANGVIALYGYMLPRPVYQQTELGHLVDKYYNVVFGEHVLPESKMVYIDNYKQSSFNQIPFVKEPLLRDESIFSEHEATVSDLVGYVRSWSAYQNFEKQQGEEKAATLLREFENEWQEEQKEECQSRQTAEDEDECSCKHFNVFQLIQWRIMDSVGARGSAEQTPLLIKYKYFVLLGRKHS